MTEIAGRRIYQSSLATDVLRKSQKLKAENELRV